MKLLAVHPSCLMYSKIYLRLEPLGLELVASAARSAGHDVRLIDLQAETQKDYFRWIRSWSPDAVVFSCNYLANVPEIIDLAKATRTLLPEALIMVGRSQCLLHGGRDPPTWKGQHRCDTQR